MKRHKVAAWMLASVAIGGTVTGCTSGSTKPQPGTTTPTVAAPPSARPLPALPTVSAQSLVIEASRFTGDTSYTSKALTSRSLTVQIACSGSPKAAVSAQIYQGAGKPIYQIARQPCDGTIQNIGLTANSLSPIRITVTTPSSNESSLLVTQG
jgi:hypothetical protein